MFGKMRLFKTLTRKLFRDIWKNFRQFISIIFIVGISVTLFVGLDANAQSFENRVNEVYKKGNIADEWITISPDFVNTEEMEADLTFIEEEAGVNSGGEVETRFYLPMSLGSTSANALIMDKLPTINIPYNLDVIYYDNNSFFLTAYHIQAGEPTAKTYYYQWQYGILPIGHYRILTGVSNWDVENGGELLAAAFDIS